MRRLPVVYRPEARRDLAGIFASVLQISQSLPVARGYVRRLIARCERIGDAPRGGRLRDDLEPGLRTVPFERSALIAYRIEGNRVRVTNVFHGGRDFEALYRGGEKPG